MEIKEYQAVIEAVLFASGEPVSVDRLAEILELDKPTVLKLAQSLQERLEQKRQRGMPAADRQPVPNGLQAGIWRYYPQR